VIELDESIISNHDVRIISIENYDTTNTSHLNILTQNITDLQDRLLTDETNLKLVNLLDVDLSTVPIDSQVLKYDSTNNI